ncbi:hypothetical protein DXG03_008644 [Asterophora parasitica]|uniref:Uncharacterized protein n=1 Tax=Asterophora parasitica TaxID=117018 RepID=A0A9P7GBU2_9AGAR|nr:hypothetical protein DXG03_008644 [Asterophora parasitica]
MVDNDPFFNAIYILGADSSKASAIYIYDATAKSWSTQEVNANGFDPKSYNAILDHDTNVFCASSNPLHDLLNDTFLDALSKGELYSLDMGDLKAANSTPVAWTDVQKPDLGSDYQPVMALAQNHIHFLDVPGVPSGSAKIFVIHFSYMQPDSQSYGEFPATHGQATSFFMQQGVQQEFAFIPDDSSATYVLNVETNTTQTLKGPITKDPMATYFASTDSLVQLSSSGIVSFLPYTAGTASANAAATWSTVSKLPTAEAPAPPNGTGTVSTSGTNTAKGAAATGGSGSNSGTVGISASVGWSMGGLVAFAIAALIL